MAEFSQGLLDDFRDFQRKKRKAAVGRISQAVGGTAEAVRTGQSAVDTFAKRAPQYDTMSSREKRAESAPLIAALGQEEQFYSSEALKKYLQDRRRESEEARAILAAAVQQRGQDVNASIARSRNTLKAESFAFADAQQKITGMTEPTDMTMSVIDGTVAKANADADAIIAAGAADTYKAMLESVPEDERTATRLRQVEKQARAQAETDPALQKQVRRIKAKAAQRATEQLFTDAKNSGAEGEELARLFSQAALGRELILGPLGVDGSRMPLSEDTAAGLRVANTELKKTIEESNTHIENQLVAARQVGAGDQTVESAVQGVLAQREARGAQPSAEAAPAQEGAPVEGEAAPGEAPPGMDSYKTFMGLQGVTPMSDSRTRTIQLLDLIEEHPEHPPLMEARNQLLQSPEFQAYKSKNNYRTDDVAFRIMRREMRQKLQDDRRADRQQVKEDVSTGRLAAPGPIRPKPAPTAPVQGSTGRPAEVARGGT